MNKTKTQQLVNLWCRSQLNPAFELNASHALTGRFPTSATLERSDETVFDIEALYEAVDKMNAIVEKPWREMFAESGADFDKHLLVIPESCRSVVDVPMFFSRSGLTDKSLGLTTLNRPPIFRSNVV